MGDEDDVTIDFSGDGGKEGRKEEGRRKEGGGGPKGGRVGAGQRKMSLCPSVRSQECGTFKKFFRPTQSERCKTEGGANGGDMGRSIQW